NPRFYLGAHLGRIHFGIEQYRQVTKHTVRKLEIALNLVHHVAAGGIIQPHVVAAAFVVNSIRELAETPLVGFEHLAPTGGDQTLEAPDVVLNLSFAEIGAKDKNGLVAPHAPSLLMDLAPKREQGAERQH